jgi:hypothetical protein
MSCKRLLGINLTFATPKRASGKRTLRVGSLCTRISPVDVLLLPRPPCCKPDVRFRPHAAAADGAVRQVKWLDMRRCNCGARMCVGCKLAGHSLTLAPPGPTYARAEIFRIAASNREEFQKDILPMPFTLCNGWQRDPVGGKMGAPTVQGLPAPRNRGHRAAREAHQWRGACGKSAERLRPASRRLRSVTRGPAVTYRPGSRVGSYCHLSAHGL